MKSDVKTSLLLLKKKLMLLSLVSTLGATSMGCSNDSTVDTKDELILETEESINEDSFVTPTYYEEEKEQLPVTKEEVMSIIDKGFIDSIYYVKEDTTLTIPSFLIDGIEEQVTLLN